MQRIVLRILISATENWHSTDLVTKSKGAECLFGDVFEINEIAFFPLDFILLVPQLCGLF